MQTSTSGQTMGEKPLKKLQFVVRKKWLAMSYALSFICKPVYSEGGTCKYVREKGRASAVFKWNFISSAPLGTLNLSAW